ncbi:unnamed protein product, partial [Iphiclides podalirius]
MTTRTPSSESQTQSAEEIRTLRVPWVVVVCIGSLWSVHDDPIGHRMWGLGSKPQPGPDLEEGNRGYSPRVCTKERPPQ